MNEGSSSLNRIYLSLKGGDNAATSNIRGDLTFPVVSIETCVQSSIYAEFL